MKTSASLVLLSWSSCGIISPTSGFNINNVPQQRMSHLAKPSRIQNRNHASTHSVNNLWRLHESASSSPSIASEDDSSSRKTLLDDLDRLILRTAIPSMINLSIVPIVNSVDTFWVGRMGIALALAGQSAANQAFFTLFFLIAFIPTITAPLVAEAVGRGDTDQARARVSESLFLSNVLGGLGTLLLVGFPGLCLKMVLPPDSSALGYALPYLRMRSLSLIPALFSATGFATYRGLLNTVTPLKVSAVTNLVNLIADPLFIFGLPGKAIATGMGVGGAALATALSEWTSGLIYCRLLFRRKLIGFRSLFKPPSLKSLLPLIQGGTAMLMRQATLNVAFLTAARRAQVMDPTGVMAAAYGIVMQIYSVGVVAHVAMQGATATLVATTYASSGKLPAQKVADRCFFWTAIVGVILATSQLFLLPILIPLFSTLPEVQEAVRTPALISSFIHLVNGVVFAGEGCMLGLRAFKALAVVTAMGVGVMVGCLKSPLSERLDGILLSLAAFCAFQAVAVAFYYLKVGLLRRGGKEEKGAMAE